MFNNARWSWPITVIPIWLFLWIHYGLYQIVHEQFSPENSRLWLLCGTTLFLLWLVHTGFSVFLILWKIKLDKRYGYFTFWMYFLFVFLYLCNFYSMLPPGIPGWVASENKRLYSLIFIAPTLFHSLLIINFNSEAVHRSWKNFSVTGGCVIACILLLISHPMMRRGIEHQLGILLFLLSLSASINGIINALNFNQLKDLFGRNKHTTVIKPLLALSFPLTAMFADNDILFDVGAGNFSNLSFYAWCAINALGICAPDFKHKTYRIVTFLVRSATYSYIIWLIIVFMPRLPLSAIAISSFGLGYLMITPLIIIIFHTKLLLDDTVYLYYHLPRQYIKTMFIAAASLPIIIYTFRSVYEHL